MKLSFGHVLWDLTNEELNTLFARFWAQKRISTQILEYSALPPLMPSVLSFQYSLQLVWIDLQRSLRLLEKTENLVEGKLEMKPFSRGKVGSLQISVIILNLLNAP
ncbi:hypothetical protein NE237_011027 [Protea cynaroides]|uniref:Uncharacterized protein n=1 Tax=Protea cynaroides TaxID=273540 RepID=A0A9Q0JVG9_9MAGN|nr:hypothetical protein NE237_011027 [Protea cynaroides]